MKYILIAAVALLALAQGSYAQDVGELERLTQYFEALKNQFNDNINSQDLASRAQSFLNERSAEMQPLVAQIRDHLRSAVANARDQIKPVADNINAQVQPMMEDFQNQMQDIVKRLMDQTQALGN